MANFEVEATTSILDQIHDLLIKAMFGDSTNKKIRRGGQATSRTQRPFVVYDLVDEDSYKKHQILKKYPSYLGVPTGDAEYKNPMNFIYQYTLVFDSSDPLCAQVTQNLIRYLVSDRFKIAMDKLDVNYFVLTKLRENNIPLEGFRDRQFQIQIKYDWADIWTDSDEGATIETIETVEVSETTAPGNA